MKPFQLPGLAAASRRWISAALFLTIFALPLHIHIATAIGAQINKECACVQGHRSQLGQIEAATITTTQVTAVALPPVAQESLVGQPSTHQLSRAPPRA